MGRQREEQKEKKKPQLIQDIGVREQSGQVERRGSQLFGSQHSTSYPVLLNETLHDGVESKCHSYHICWQITNATHFSFKFTETNNSLLDTTSNL